VKVDSFLENKKTKKQKQKQENTDENATKAIWGGV